MGPLTTSSTSVYGANQQRSSVQLAPQRRYSATKRGGTTHPTSTNGSTGATGDGPVKVSQPVTIIISIEVSKNALLRHCIPQLEYPWKESLWLMALCLYLVPNGKDES